jgi:hypothetical protein
MKFVLATLLLPFSPMACVNCQQQMITERQAAYTLYLMQTGHLDKQYYYGKYQGLNSACKIYNDIHNICETYENEQAIFESGIGLD